MNKKETIIQCFSFLLNSNLSITVKDVVDRLTEMHPSTLWKRKYVQAVIVEYTDIFTDNICSYVQDGQVHYNSARMNYSDKYVQPTNTSKQVTFQHIEEGNSLTFRGTLKEAYEVIDALDLNLHWSVSKDEFVSIEGMATPYLLNWFKKEVSFLSSTDLNEFCGLVNSNEFSELFNRCVKNQV